MAASYSDRTGGGLDPDIVDLGAVHIKCDQPFTKDITMRDTNDNLIDFTAWTGRVAIGQTYSGVAIVLVAPTLTVAGLIQINLTKELTALLQPYADGPLVLQVGVRKNDGTVAHLFQGTVTAHPEIDISATAPAPVPQPNAGVVLSYSTRALFVADTGTTALVNGVTIRAGAHGYQRLVGATTLADKAGWVPLPPYDLAQWGVVSTTDPATVTDQSTKVQAAITYCANGELRFSGNVGLASQIGISEPFIFDGAGFGDTTTSASGPVNPSSAIVAMTLGVTLFRPVGANSGERMYGLMMRNFALKGQNLAAKGIYGSSLSDCSFEGIAADRFTGSWLDIDTANAAISSNNRVQDCSYQSGSSAACRASSGVKIDGTNSYGATQYTIRNYRGNVHSWRILSVANNAGVARFTAENAEVPGAPHQILVGDVISIYNSRLYSVRDVVVTAVPVAGITFETGAAYSANEVDGRVAIGWGLSIGDCDSSVVTQYSGTNMLLLGTRASQRAARKNTFLHVAAHVVHDAGSINIIAGAVNSEPSSVTPFGVTVLVWRAMDRDTGGTYDSANTYVMQESVWLPMTAALLSGTGTGTIGGAAVPVVTFPEAGTPTATWIFSPPPNWDTGTIPTISLHYSGGTSGNMYLTTTISTPVTGGGGLGTWDTTVNTAVPAQSTPGVYVLPITVSQVYTRGDAVMVSISRAPAHASDTSTAAFSMYGIDAVYADTGPNGAGANVFGVSARRLP